VQTHASLMSHNNVLEDHRREVASIQNEIDQLREELVRRQLAQISNRSWKSVLSLSAGNEDDPDEKLHLSLAQTELELLKQFTGITVDEVHAALNVTDSAATSQFTVQGKCHDTLFELQFVLSKNKEGKEGISNLQIDSMDYINTQLGHLLDEFEKQQSIDRFTSMLSSYTRQTFERSACLSQLRSKYPQSIQLPHGPGGDTLIITGVKYKLKLMFLWKIDASFTSVKSSFDLKVQDFESDIMTDNLRSAVSNFQLLLDDVGPIKALETLIEIVHH